ncbi:hypothetical protein PCC9214_01761 [Planktothrix tepida]|uniref:VWFA domain-containing protein n=2 Tax=Planktothrix TaxID=54304 RepID=A0A1J1LMW3_9CYAN|nr:MULTISPECIES: hypothetical protein [Planktothrix]CAD5938473.1 hypothetical protein PCC9214_01761 [Planktothrix tepida]CAD5973260.1 hypothetical protein NO713_03976 [Planktothrix pseudagardhii]CUR33276.1 conserved hypothetical protein [Planktothrix tepida PCC 9214]
MDILLEGGSVLRERDYTLIIDSSNSMATLEQSEGKSRWELLQESILAIASYCEQFDPDGITLYLFSDQFQRYEKVTSDKVIYIFEQHQPSGTNRLSPVLKDATDNYFGRRATEQAKANGETIIIVTSGEIENPTALRQIMIDAANQLNRDEELAIELIQVGSNSDVTEFFHILDDDLQSQGAKFDICNTITLSDLGAMSLMDVLLKAIVD